MKTESFTIIVMILSLTSFLAPIATSQVQGPVSITSNSKSDFGPVISSDGSKVAFWSDLDGDPEIYVMNNDGTGLRQLTFNTANDTAPSISGDGTKVAFQADVGGPDFEIFIINSDGSGLLRLTSNNDEDMQPCLSSDGLTVAFTSTGTLDPAGLNPEGDAEIFVMRTDGTGIRQLTSNGADDTSPSISADGSRIAYQSASLASHEIFIVNSDGTGRTRLTNNVDDDVSPSIAADGGKVAFSSTGPAILAPPPVTLANRIADAANPYEVFIVNSDGTGLNQVSSTLGDNFEPSLSGDGNKVAYVSTGDGDREIFIANSDGQGLTQITHNLAFDFEPSLSHTGGIVVFSSNLDGDFDIFISRPVGEVHDVAVVGITVPRRVGYNTIQSNPLLVNVTVQNQGSTVETFAVEISFLNGPLIGSQTTTVSPGANKTLTFGFSPQSLAIGTYTLVARAVAVPGELDTSDNVLQDGTVEVRIPGDVDGDRDVDIIDAATLAYHYGRTCASGSFYILEADFDNDCDIDIIDAAILAFYYGTRAS